MESIFFQRRTDGINSNIGLPIQIGKLPGTGVGSYVQPEYRKTQQGGIIRWEVDVPVVPYEPTDNDYDLSLMREGINAYLSDLLKLMQFAPIELRTMPNGKNYVSFRNQQRGDLIVKTLFESEVIETNVAISDARIIEDEMMMSGGMVIRIVFVKESDLQLPDQRWASFRIRAGGTGSQLAQIAITDNGTQSSRLTTFEIDSAGPIQRLVISAWYSSEAGARSLASIIGYPDLKKADMLWSPVIIKNDSLGRPVILNTRNNFGDITIDSGFQGSAVITLLQNAVLQDIAIVSYDEGGGVQIQYTFISVKAEFRPPLRYFRFRISNSPTVTVPLGVNDPESAWLGELSVYGSGKLTLATVRSWMPNDHGATELLDVQSKGEAIRNACRFSPPLLKDMPRGKAIMPKIQNNFGTLYYSNSYLSGSETSGTMVLTNCTMMEPPKVFESLNEGGVGMEFTFGRVADSNRVTT